MIVVLVTPVLNEGIVRAMVPAAYVWTLTVAADDRVYRVFKADGEPMTHEFLGLDGELLASLHSFKNHSDAVVWVRHQCTQRAALLAFTTGVMQ